jgi:hypothetical protein
MTVAPETEYKNRLIVRQALKNLLQFRRNYFPRLPPMPPPPPPARLPPLLAPELAPLLLLDPLPPPKAPIFAPRDAGVAPPEDPRGARVPPPLLA